MCILREISEEALHILITDGKTYTFVKKKGNLVSVLHVLFWAVQGKKCCTTGIFASKLSLHF